MMAWLLLTLLGLAWAVRLIAIKATAATASPIDIVFFATAGVLFVTSALNVIRRRSMPVSLQHVRFYLIAGIFGFGAPFFVETIVAPHLKGLAFVVVVTSTPIWVAFLGLLSRAEALSWHRAASVGIGFFATVLVLVGSNLESDLTFESANMAWYALALFIPALYAIYITYVAKFWPADLDNMQGAQGQALIALVIFLVIWIASGSNPVLMMQPDVAMPLFVIVLAEISGLILLFQLARTEGGNFTAQANYIAVVFGSALGVALFDQTANFVAALGVVLLVFAMWLSSRAAKADEARVNALDGKPEEPELAKIRAKRKAPEPRVAEANTDKKR